MGLGHIRGAHYGRRHHAAGAQGGVISLNAFALVLSEVAVGPAGRGSGLALVLRSQLW